MGCDRLRRKRKDIGEAPPTLRCAIAPPYSPRGILRELLRDPNILPLPGEGELLGGVGCRGRAKGRFAAGFLLERRLECG